MKNINGKLLHMPSSGNIYRIIKKTKKIFTLKHYHLQTPSGAFLETQEFTYEQLNDYGIIFSSIETDFNNWLVAK